MIMDQRSETEEIFLECLSECKEVIGVEKIVAGQIKGKPDKKVLAVGDMEWSHREMILKSMF